VTPVRRVLESPLRSSAGAVLAAPRASLDFRPIDVREERVDVVHHGVTIEECPDRHGLWLTESEMHTLAKRGRNSWIGRYFYRLKPPL
jgi:hypothetical protein